MRTIAFVNQGGSAGKTTTVVSIAALLAEAGRRVLLWDNDPQGNATRHLGVTAASGKTSADVLERSAELAAVIAPSSVAGLDVVPANADLNAAAVGLQTVVGGEQRLRLALAEIEDRYDYTLIDCPGSLNVLAVAALVAADQAVTTTLPTLKEIEALPHLLGTVTDVATSYNAGLQVTAIIPCRVPPPAAGLIYAEAMDYLRATYGDLVAPSVRQSVRVPEAYARGLPVIMHEPLGGVSADYQAVYDWMRHRGILGA